MNYQEITDKFQAKLRNLPDSPGVYEFKDKQGKIIYIGKAKSLKNRVRQYFQSTSPSFRISSMVSKISDFEVIKTDSEVESLILELNLIKQYKPKYNVTLKDDKSYPYIVITNEPFPRIFPVRKKKMDGSRYYGPYTDVKTMRYALRVVRNIFMIRSCKLNLTKENIEKKKFKVCLDYHIQKCSGPCEGLISEEEYNKTIEHVANLLQGKTKSLIKILSEEMERFAKEMKFEEAAKIRNKREAIKVYSSKQKIITEDEVDKDVFALAAEGNDACGVVLKIREGKVVGKSQFYLANILEKDKDEILETFLTNYYTNSDFIPDEVLLPENQVNLDVIKSWLESKKNSPVKMSVPKVGDKAKLISMVKANADFALSELKVIKLKGNAVPTALQSLKEELNLSTLPIRIECYDISHIQGTDTVASRVVFFNGKPKRTYYRKYKLISNTNVVGEPDDYTSMREVIYRRFSKAEIKDDPLPNLVVIDGGKGQLSAAVWVLESLGYRIEKRNLSPGITNLPQETEQKIAVIGLAKKLEEIYFPDESLPFTLSKSSPGLRLLQRIRNEAHRFAVEYHKKLRKKRTLRTELTEIEGIGEKTAVKLLTTFNSVENIKTILTEKPEELTKIVSTKIIEKLKRAFDLKTQK
ncbi:MAG: excinuclease ABC subunit UvrC [Ignavibacteria bacterium]